MKRREQALLLLAKAAQDESLLDAVMDVDTVADEVFGFHCQQAAEKMIKALLSDAGMPFQKTHNIAALMETLAGAGMPLPDSFEELETFTPFGALYRYEDLDSAFRVDRQRARTTLRLLRVWVEEQMESSR
jgi:HEPN domain-containing protein